LFLARLCDKPSATNFIFRLEEIMKPVLALLFLSVLILFASCQPAQNNSNTTVTTAVTPPTAQELKIIPRPQSIEDMMKQRGEQDQAQPMVKIVSPAKNATINGSTVEVKLELSGDLKGYMPHKDPATGKGNHIHVILDNQPYEAYYEIGQPFEMRNVAEGKHTLRVFPSRPWHESFKNEGAFQMVSFTVKGGGDTSKPTVTNSGQKMASPSASPGASPAPSREGKDFASSSAGNVDPAKPLLTYSRPKGEYTGADTAAIMIDFWLLNAKLQGDGGEYRVHYTIDNNSSGFIDNWNPIWLTGWTNGKHIVKLELTDKNGQPIDNGGYNSTSREINVVKQ